MTLATWFTLLRFALVPTLIAAFYGPAAHRAVYAAGTLAVAGLTDVLDGYLARRRGEESTTGRLLDPLADKLVILTGIVLLVIAGRLRPWIAWALLGKELALIGGAAWFYGKRREMLPATWIGKTAAVLFYGGLFLGILAPRAVRTSEVVILAALVLSVAAGFTYARRAVHSLKGDS